VGPDKHGYLNNDDRTAPAVADRYGLFPSLFVLLKERRPESKLAAFYEWDGISVLCPDDVFDRKEHIPDLSDNLKAVEDMADYIKNEKPDLTVIHFDGVDHAGHSSGYDTPAYYEMLKTIDNYIGIIKQEIMNSGIYEDTVFIVSADHGGIGTGHGGDTPSERQIPIILYGKNIRSAYEIAEPANIYDIAPTIASILNLSPSFWDGRPLNVFRE
jgi:predicted AlkP superfamily pyrophosphatase or phosphodiesterase